MKHKEYGLLRCPMCDYTTTDRVGLDGTTEFYFHLAEHGAIRPTNEWCGETMNYICACGFRGHWLLEMIPHFAKVEHDWSKVIVRSAMENM